MKLLTLSLDSESNSYMIKTLADKQMAAMFYKCISWILGINKYLNLKGFDWKKPGLEL